MWKICKKICKFNYKGFKIRLWKFSIFLRLPRKAFARFFFAHDDDYKAFPCFVGNDKQKHALNLQSVQWRRICHFERSALAQSEKSKEFKTRFKFMDTLLTLSMIRILLFWVSETSDPSGCKHSKKLKHLSFWAIAKNP